MKTTVTIVVVGMIICALVWVAAGPKVSPEMEECLQSHGSRDQYAAVLKKYCSPEIINQAMALLVVKNPRVIRIRHTGKTDCYLVEGSLGETTSKIPGETTRNYCVCWENGRVVSLDFSGARFRAYGG